MTVRQFLAAQVFKGRDPISPQRALAPPAAGTRPTEMILPAGLELVDLVIARANLRPLDLGKMEREFLSQNSVGRCGNLMVYNPRQGSWRPEKDKLSRWLKMYLTLNNQTHFWTEDIISRFRSFLLVDAQEVPSSSINHSNKSLTEF